MILTTTEFVRRFCLHVLPERFVKIRHYGLLGNRQRQARLAVARQLLGTPPAAPQPPTPVPVPEAKPACCPFRQRPGLVRGRLVPPHRVGFLDSS